MIQDSPVQSVRLRIRSNESTESGASWKDVYTLIIDESGVHPVKVFESDVPRYDAFFENEGVDLGDIPDPVLAVMQRYVSDKVVNWPSSPSPQAADVEQEEAEISIEADDNKYSFMVYGGEHVRIKRNGEPIRADDVPKKIQSEADQFIPKGAKYL
ncbi:hypothetical protein [Halobacterium sp. KA-6]|uniref:hypothetical protein n=1 Tax=Halobacterium sp. KA-6 TaxID=2896368 RepID=UPI001E3F18EA|nr:hypothetical protein [Halobacterium sp. KA-6]MCD2204418.1 hypothetical protein [Halobacterium sp. KA-6]